MEKLMITNNELIRLTPMMGNIDVDKYQMIIEECQTFVIEPLLGTKLFKKILLDYPDELGGHYLEIHKKYLLYILANTVAAEHILISPFLVKNGGVFKHLPQNGEPASMDEVEKLSNGRKLKADVYIERLQKYLCDKGSEIDEYTLAQDEGFDIKPDKDLSTHGGWRLESDAYTPTNAERAIWDDIRHDEGR